MLIIFRRHLKSCPHRKDGRKYRRCRCPIHVEGFLGNEPFRKALHTLIGRRSPVLDWEGAQGLIRDWEAAGERKVASTPITLHNAWEQYLEDASARHLAESTIRKYRYAARNMELYAEKLGFRYLKEFTLEALRKYRSSWPNENLSALKRLGLLRSFFRFGCDSGWIPDNPAKKLRNPKIVDRPTMPFDSAEMVRILTALNAYGDAKHLNVRRVRALVLLMRFTGLRISDAATLPCARIVDGKLFLYTSKAGTPVHCPLPPVVIQALEGVRRLGEPYFFWTGRSKPKTVITHWWSCIRKVFELARVDQGHPHRFRDTFAVDLLLQGVPLERVSVLLGHKSIKVTEKHYAPWIRARQEQLEADVKRVWESHPEALGETNHTYNTRGKTSRAN
jgi:site-specific recombinase XerD